MTKTIGLIQKPLEVSQAEINWNGDSKAQFKSDALRCDYNIILENKTISMRDYLTSGTKGQSAFFSNGEQDNDQLEIERAHQVLQKLCGRDENVIDLIYKSAHQQALAHKSFADISSLMALKFESYQKTCGVSSGLSLDTIILIPGDGKKIMLQNVKPNKIQIKITIQIIKAFCVKNGDFSSPSEIKTPTEQPILEIVDIYDILCGPRPAVFHAKQTLEIHDDTFYDIILDKLKIAFCLIDNVNADSTNRTSRQKGYGNQPNQKKALHYFKKLSLSQREEVKKDDLNAPGLKMAEKILSALIKDDSIPLEKKIRLLLSIVRHQINNYIERLEGEEKSFKELGIFMIVSQYTDEIQRNITLMSNRFLSDEWQSQNDLKSFFPDFDHFLNGLIRKSKLYSDSLDSSVKKKVDLFSIFQTRINNIRERYSRLCPEESNQKSPRLSTV
jgi:hypothetical protein